MKPVACLFLVGCFSAQPALTSRIRVTAVQGDGPNGEVDTGFRLSGADLDLATSAELDGVGALSLVSVTATEMHLAFTAATAEALGRDAREVVLRLKAKSGRDATMRLSLLRGPDGQPGPRGPSASIAVAPPLAFDGNTLEVACPVGHMVQHVGDTFLCAAPLQSLTPGEGITISGSQISAAVGPGNSEAAVFGHTHFGETWIANSATPTLTLTDTSSPGSGETQAGLVAVGHIARQGNRDRAAMRGHSNAIDHGVGVLGHAFNQDNGAGVRGYAAGTGSHGVGSFAQSAITTASAIEGHAAAADSTGVIARHGGGGVALAVQGHTFLSAISPARLPISVVVAAAPSGRSFAACPSNAMAIGGGCDSVAGVLTYAAPSSFASCMATADPNTLPTGPTTGPAKLGVIPTESTGYCCHNASTTTAEATCLQVSP